MNYGPLGRPRRSMTSSKPTRDVSVGVDGGRSTRHAGLLDRLARSRRTGSLRSGVGAPPRLRRQAAEADRFSVHREGLDEAAVLAVLPRSDQDCDFVADFHHVARESCAIEVTRAVTLVLRIASTALVIRDLHRGPRVRI